MLYYSNEESVNKTILDRINNFNIDAQRLFVANAINFDQMCDYIQKNYYRLVIIDSMKYMNPTIDQLKELHTIFSKRQLSVIMIDFGESKGKPARSKDLIHASDVKMYFKDGTVHSTSRYLDKPVQTRLFTLQMTNKQPT